jgi:uncharacterized protein
MTGPTVDELVRRLDLARHPEGGWYRETYRSGEIIPVSALPERFGGPRPFSTSIYFLLEQGEISALHRIKSDEIWHFHAGAPLMIHIITPRGGHQELKLGPDLSAGESFQIVVEAGCWFGAEVSRAGTYSLVGCTVSPGFDFADFQLGNRSDLLHEFPLHKEIITRLTRSTD